MLLDLRSELRVVGARLGDVGRNQLEPASTGLTGRIRERGRGAKQEQRTREERSRGTHSCSSTSPPAAMTSGIWDLDPQVRARARKTRTRMS
jgi:hypothetical protein